MLILCSSWAYSFSGKTRLIYAHGAIIVCRETVCNQQMNQISTNNQINVYKFETDNGCGFQYTEDDFYTH